MKIKKININGFKKVKLKQLTVLLDSLNKNSKNNLNRGADRLLLQIP